MHSHSQTLLSKLGFSDADKKSDRHDLACRYVADEEVARRVFGIDEKRKVHPELEFVIKKGSGQFLQHIGFADVVLKVGHYDCDAHMKEAIETQRALERVRYEKRQLEIAEWSKKYNEWRRVRWEASSEVDRNSGLRILESDFSLKRPEYIPEEPEIRCSPVPFRCMPPYLHLVEVKISKTSAADCLRQLKLYRQYEKFLRSSLVVDFQMTAGEVASLKADGVDVFRLGDGFERWIAADSRVAQEMVDI